MDRIIIKELEVDAHIGVTESERKQAQRLLITVEMERDLTEAGRRDADVPTTQCHVDADRTRTRVMDRPRKVFEADPDEIAEAILTRQMAHAVTVEVKKFSIPRSQYVSIRIHRTQ